MIIAVNGTLMRGLAANYILAGVGAVFLREAHTAPCYRLWNVAGKHPGMLRDDNAGASISLELWEIGPERIMEVLEQEPPGLVLGRILLNNRDVVMGILAEPYILAGCEEITSFHGWREYQNTRDSKQQSSQAE